MNPHTQEIGACHSTPLGVSLFFKIMWGVSKCRQALQPIYRGSGANKKCQLMLDFQSAHLELRTLSSNKLTFSNEWMTFQVVFCWYNNLQRLGVKLSPKSGTLDLSCGFKVSPQEFRMGCFQFPRAEIFRSPKNGLMNWKPIHRLGTTWNILTTWQLLGPKP